MFSNKMNNLITTHNTRGVLLVSLMISASAFALPAIAGEADENIEEIVVEGSYTVAGRLNTATGLGLSLQETPQSVSVMTYQRIEDQNLQSLTDIVNNAVGISAKELDSSRHSFSARGFSISSYQLDGVPLAWNPGGNSGETQVDTTLYERIEIVRGSTGLLTGAGDPSASINLVRKHANSDELKGYVAADAGSWDNYGVTLDLSSPFNAEGTIRGRVVAKYNEGDSFRERGGNKKTVLYGTVEADVTDNLLLRVGASYQDNDPSATTWGGLPTWYSDGTRTNWDRKKSVAPDWSYWASKTKNYFASIVYDFADDWTAKINYNRNETSADLKLLFLFGVLDSDTGEGLGASPYLSDTFSNQDSIDFQVQGAFSLFGRSHELVFGGLYSKQKTEVGAFGRTDVAPIGDFINYWDGSYPEPTWGIDRNISSAFDIKQTGFYAASRINVSDELKLVAGGRLAKWDQEGTVWGDPVEFGDSGVFIPYAGALYNVDENHTVYASYTEIFEPQNSQDRNGDYLPPVVGKSYELGLKSTFFDDTLHTTATIFLIEQDNLAQPDPGFLIPGTIFEASKAAKGAESKGFEVEVVGEVYEGWNVALGYTNFKVEDAEGNDVNTSQPRKLLRLFTTYNFMNSLDGLTIGGGVNWEGSNYTERANPVTAAQERLEQKSYALVNLMARYDVTEQFSIQANVDNLFDKTYFSQIGFYGQYAHGEPRNFSIKARYNF